MWFFFFSTERLKKNSFFVQSQKKLQHIVFPDVKDELDRGTTSYEKKFVQDCTFGSHCTAAVLIVIMFNAHIIRNAPYAWGNFHACAFTRFQKPQQLGRARIARSSIVTSRTQRAKPDLSGRRCCKLRLKLLLVDQLAKKT